MKEGGGGQGLWPPKRRSFLKLRGVGRVSVGSGQLKTTASVEPRMPSASRYCRHCQKDFYAADFFSHLNSKHPSELWTEYNQTQIKLALTRSAHTHDIRLKIDGEYQLFSPFRRRLYADAQIAHAVRAGFSTAEREERWTTVLHSLALPPNPTPATPPPAAAAAVVETTPPPPAAVPDCCPGCGLPADVVALAWKIYKSGTKGGGASEPKK